MNKKKVFINIILVYLIFFINSAYSFKNRIIANVGSEIISSYELKNKIKTILFLSNQEISQNNINNIKEQAIRNLIDDKLKKEEILKFKIPIENNKNSSNYLNQISAKYNTDVSGLKKIFFANQIDFEIYTQEIYTQFAWNKLIVSLYQNKINLNENEINKELQKSIKDQKNISEYNLSQIELPILEDKSKNLKQIEDVKNEIINIGFENTAIKYSAAASSIEGGNLGWISSEAISPSISKVLENMKSDEVSEPIFQTDTILFLKLMDKRSVKIDNINYDRLREKIISRKKNELLNLFSNNHLSKIKNNALIQIK